MSNSFWIPAHLPEGGSAEPEIIFHILSAFSVSGQTAHKNLGSSRVEMIKEVPAAEAKKAEGASLATNDLYTTSINRH